MFKRAPSPRPVVAITVDGKPVEARRGDTVASALLAAGYLSFTDTPRRVTPYCLIGNCFGCLCEIDGRRGVQACLAPVRDGMVVRTGHKEPDR